MEEMHRTGHLRSGIELSCLFNCIILLTPEAFTNPDTFQNHWQDLLQRLHYLCWIDQILVNEELNLHFSLHYFQEIEGYIKFEVPNYF